MPMRPGLDWISSIKLASSLCTLLTRLLTGRATSQPAGDGLRRFSASCLVKDAKQASAESQAFENDGHSVMDWLGLLTCRCRLDGSGSVQLLCILPKTSKPDREPIATREVKGLLCTTWKFLPLVVSTGGNDTAPALKRIAERGLA